MLILFGINPHTCQQCPLKAKCFADDSQGTGGRRVTVIRKKLTTPPPQPPPVVAPQPLPVPLVTTQPTLPVLWLNFPTTRLRRDLTHQLHQQQIVIEAMAGSRLTPPPKPSLITRDQRAHRRFTWTQRWERNAITDAVSLWQSKLFGLSSAVLDWLRSLKPRPAVII